MSRFGFESEERGEVALVTLRGELDLLSTGELEPELERLADEPGVEVVGPLPESISTPTRLSGFIGAKAKDPKAAKELLDYLSSADAAKVYKERGMVPGK